MSVELRPLHAMRPKGLGGLVSVSNHKPTLLDYSFVKTSAPGGLPSFGTAVLTYFLKNHKNK